MNEPEYEGHDPLPQSSAAPANQIDTIYYNAMVKVISRYNRYVSYHCCKIIALVIFTAVHFNSQEGTDRTLMVPFILATVAAALYIWLYAYTLHHLKSVPENLRVASNFNHTAAAASIISPVTLESIRSETYDFANAATNELPQEHKNKLEATLSNTLESTHMLNLRLTRLFVVLLNLLSLSLILYFIVELSNHKELDTACKVMASLFIVVESLAKIDILLLLVFCFFLPLFFLLACCCVCCCGRRATSVMPEIPTVKYSLTLSLECDPECRICFQSFVAEEEIMLLPCDKRHVFHKFCAESWFKVSTTCPICRKNLSVSAEEAA